MLQLWRDNAAAVQPTLERYGLLAEAGPVASNLGKVAAIGLEALEFAEGGKTAPEGWAKPRRATLDEAAKPSAEVLLMAVPGVRALVDAVAGGAK
jgi:hypothetical protein